jgi:hypothetical protein
MASFKGLGPVKLEGVANLPLPAKQGRLTSKAQRARAVWEAVQAAGTEEGDFAMDYEDFLKPVIEQLRKFGLSDAGARRVAGDSVGGSGAKAVRQVEGEKVVVLKLARDWAIQFLDEEV